MHVDPNSLFHRKLHPNSRGYLSAGGYVHLDQYKNPANPEAHYLTTGPEIWRQTEGTITHFVAGLGTCGTITGTGRFLKEKRKDVKVIGVHPVEGHDIPGVRSIRQLKQTALFFPNEYDQLVEVHDEQSFELCRRINQEESIIAGPSSAMALAGALRVIPDQPGVVAVVIFPDNAFKYASSMRKHLPELFSSAKPEGNGLSSNLAKIVDFARESDDVIEAQVAYEQIQQAPQSVSIVDVRGEKEFQDSHVPGAINVPLPDIAGGYAVGLPDDKAATIYTICKVGERSLYGMLLLKALGYRDVRSIRGGTKAWVESGYPTVS